MRFHFGAWLVLLLAVGATAARAQDSQPFKLTLGLYQAGGGELPAGTASDLNLRHSSGLGNVW
ncbi:MAG: hypothetical protein VW687_16415, partial [Curvibacter sp.]